TAIDLRVQACAHPGCCLRVVIKEYTTAVSSADCPGLRKAVARHHRHAASTHRTSLHGGRAHRAGDALLISGWAKRHPTVGVWGSDGAPDHGTRTACDPPGDVCPHAAGTRLADDPRQSPGSGPGQWTCGRRQRLHPCLDTV